MNNQDEHHYQAETNQEPTISEFSDRRRVVTAVLVLVAALLLGYVLYALVAAPSASVEPVPVQTPEMMVAPSELSAEERQVILNAMQDSEVQITSEEEAERRAVLNAINSDDVDELSVEERNAIMQAMP